MIRRSMLQAFQVAAAPPKNIQLFFIGDSITRGIGTTGSGFAGNTTGQIYNGPNSYANKTLASLTTSGLNVTGNVQGWSGQTATWFVSNAMNRTIAMFDKTNYTDIYCVIYFGTNDMAATGGYESASTFQTNLTTVCNALKSAGAKVIIVPCLDIQTSGNNNTEYNASRATYYSWLQSNWSTIADGLADTGVYPLIFADGAASNTTYFASVAADPSGAGALHPTDAGAALIADAIVPAVQSLALTSSLEITPPNEAVAFIAAAGITDSTTISAIETLVASLKAAKLWWKLRCLYPFVGGTAASCKYNLRDTTLNTLAFTGTPTFDETGVTWAGGSYGDTGFIQIPTSDFESCFCSLHYYSRSNISAGIDMGVFGSGLTPFWFGLNTTGDGVHSQLNFYGGANSLPYSNYTGLFSVCRANDFNYDNLYRNGTIAARYADTASFNTPQASTTIGIDGDGLAHPSPRNCAYAAIGYGLTDAEEAEHYTIIQAFQTILGRKI